MALKNKVIKKSFIKKKGKKSESGQKKARKIKDFQKRKKEHLKISLNPKAQSQSGTGLDRIELQHEALPEINFEEVNLETDFFNQKMNSPIFISSMTAGHSQGEVLNSLFARVCQEKKWALGIGSQRLHLMMPGKAIKECENLRKKAPGALFMSNIGLTEVIDHPPKKILELTQALEATALIVHTNPLQECFQEGASIQFKGGLKALENLIQEARTQKVPVLLKETGCGFSKSTLEKIKSLKISALDIGGLGGTHWGLVEGSRTKSGIKKRASKNFSTWGVSTLDSLLYSLEVETKYEVWASGGVRSGVDAAKLLSLGAKKVGIAKPFMKEALKGEKALISLMDQLEFELKVALFCTGCKDLKSLRAKKPWNFKKIYTM